MDLQNTFLNNLSAVLQSALTAVQTPEFTSLENNLISALQLKPDLTQLDAIINELSSIPLHPYEHLLWEHFEPDHKFKTIDDVEDPGDIPTEQCIKYITQKEQELGSTIFHNLTCCPEHRVTSGFEVLSGNKVLCDIQKQKNYLEFFEMIRQIPLNSITPENSNIIFNKIVGEYIKVI